jgi:putative ABC transport system permease protein
VNGIGAHPDVVALARSQSFPGMGTSMRNLLREGETGEGSALMTCRATAPVMEVLGIRLLAGNSLPLEKERSDTTIQVVVNQAIARYLGHSPEDLVGRLVNIAGFSPLCEVVGVMDDFHNSSLHQPMQLFCYHNAPTEGYSYLLVKVKTTRLTDTMAELENTFLQHIPAAFSYTFLDEHLAGLYQSEKRMSGIVGIFSGMAIFIACLGLYALVAFITEMRKREIGVRKILGASATQLVRLLSREFLGLIGLAIVLGAPLGHWLLVKWLEGFAYKVTITPTLWILAGSACMAIAMCTVGIELWKATRANPVHTLKSEG